MRKKLTAEEYVSLEEYRQARFDRAIAPVDKPKAEACLRQIMRRRDIDTGTIIWAHSQRVAQVIIASLMGYSTSTPRTRVSDKTLQLATASLAMHGEKLVSNGYKERNVPWFVGDGWSNGWIAFYSFAGRLDGVEIKADDKEMLAIYEDLSNCASSIYSYKGVSVMVERPITKWTSAMLADRPVLHCVDGPSVYFDDYQLYHWRGTMVPEQWIMAPESVDPALAISHENTELRLALCEILGWEKVMKHLNPKTIDKDPNPMFGELLECDLPGSGRTRFLRAMCGTGKMITILADENAKTAVGAGAASYGFPEDLYRQMKLRT